MYTTPEEVLANVKGIDNQGVEEITTELIQTFIDEGAAEINGKLDSIYVMPLPDPPAQGQDPLASARASLKSLLKYYCLVRLELFTNITPDEDEYGQSLVDKKSYESMYMAKLDGLLMMEETLVGVEKRPLVESSFPPSQFDSKGPQW